MANRNIYKKETAHFTLKLMQTNSNIRETTSVNEFSLFVIGYVVLFVRPPARPPFKITTVTDTVAFPPKNRFSLFSVICFFILLTVI